MKIKHALVLVLFTITSSFSQSLYFPPLVGNAWDTVSATSLGWCQNKVDSLTDFVGLQNSKAFIVLKDGKIVIEKYYGTFTKDSLWYWASAGKTMTALLVGIAQQEGFLNIDSATSKYNGTGWTACTSYQEKQITVRNQLTMTTGLDDGVFENDCTIDTCLQFLANASSRWAYHNAPYTLLDSVIHYSTNQSFSNYFTSKIKNKIGMNGLWYPSGYNNVYYSNARSFARFGLLLLNKAKWNNTVVLSDSAYFNSMTNTSQNINLSYGYLTWLNGKQTFMLPQTQTIFTGSILPNAPPDLFAALGKNGQFINIVPSMNLVLIRMGNPPADGTALPILFNNEIWQKLNDVFCNNTAISSLETTINDVLVYPNPSKTILNFKTDNLVGNYTITTTTASGAIVACYKNVKQIDVSMYEKGIYYIKIIDNTRMYNKMFLKE